MTKIKMDIKEMPQNHGYTHILVLLCEVYNFLVALSLHLTRTEHIIDVFQRLFNLPWSTFTYYLRFGSSFHFFSDESLLKTSQHQNTDCSCN